MSAERMNVFICSVLSTRWCVPTGKRLFWGALCLSVSLSLCLSLTLSPFLSVSVFVFFSLSLFVFVSLSLSLSLSG